MIDNEDFMTRNLKILREHIKNKPNPYIFTAEEVKLKKIEFVARDMLKALGNGEIVEVKEFIDSFIDTNNLPLDVALSALDLLIQQDKIIHVNKGELKYIAIRNVE